LRLAAPERGKSTMLERASSGTTIFEPKPRRVRNIFICSGVVFLRLVEDDETI